MKRQILSLLTSALLIVSLASCGSSGVQAVESTEPTSLQEEAELQATSPEGEAEGGAVWDAYSPYPETIAFTKARSKPSYDQGFTNNDSILDNPYTRYVKEVVNVQPELAWEVDANTYDQKLSLSIASGEIPDVMVVNRKFFKQLVNNDLIQEMGPAYEQCISPFLKEQYDSYGDRIFEECTVDGKLMGIPGTQIFGQNFAMAYIRTDYLEKVGMDMPESMDDLRAIAKAFVDNDVSGTGKTVGLTLSEKVYEKGWSNYGANSAFFADGAYPGWWIDGADGKAVYGSIQPEMKITLQRFRDMYEEGSLDKEFVVRKSDDRNALVASGQLGIHFGNWWPTQAIGDGVFNNKEADFMPVVIPGSDGTIAVPQDDPVNNIMVVRKGFEYPEALVKVLNVEYDAIRGNDDGKRIYDDIRENSPNLDWGTCPIGLQIDSYDAIELLTNDLKQALEKDDRDAMVVQAQNANFDVIKRERENPKADAGNYTTAMARTLGSEALLADRISVKEIPFFGQTETMTGKWANLEKLEQEMMVQIIMGEKPVEYFDDFVQQWYALGGQEITDEVNAEIGR